MNSYAQLKLDIQGHRGCRGLMPENTIPAFLKAIDLKVNTLEMDVVISKDKKVVVSHEPSINAAICLDKNGSKLLLTKENELNLYTMNYEEIKEYDCGSLDYARFPSQLKIKTYKPLLSEVFDSVKTYCMMKSLPLPYFNIEIKSDIQQDKVFNPFVAEFCELVITEVFLNKIHDHCIIQSFDTRVLKYLHSTYPSLRLAFLTEEINDFNKIKEAIGFIPSIYSPAKELVTKKLVTACHDHNVQIIPWTVNEIKEINQLIAWGVDGIISDYPDRIVLAK